MGQTYTVLESGKNTFGFGNVKVDGGENLHDKGKWGFGTGEKENPQCKPGDTIEADIGSNAKGYPEIKNIKVVASGASVPAQGASSSGGSSQYRSVPELNRRDALELAIKNRNEVGSTTEIISDAIEFDAFITDGMDSEILQNMPMDDDTLAEEDDKFKTKKKK